MSRVLLAIVVAACGTPTLEADAPPADPAEQVEIVDQGLGTNIQIIPSLPETQVALERAGIEVQLGSLIPARTYDLEHTDADLAAVRTGVVLADLLLTVKSAEKDELLQRLSTIDSGMKRVESGPTIEATMAKLVASVEADATSRDGLLEGFRDLSREIISELEYRDKAKVVPLIQAGAYLEGANLVARALQSVKERKGGDDLLKQGKAVNYFIEFVSTEAGTRISRETRSTLLDVLTSLKTVADKQSELTGEDLATVVAATESVLGFL